MGKLARQIDASKWLGEGRRRLFPLVNSIEQWILTHKKPSRPNLDLMFSCFTKITNVPNLIIVGQDPYPDEKATGVAFQTKNNVRSPSLDCIAKNLGYQCENYPDLEHWVVGQNILMMNAAMCNFGRCGKRELFDKWHSFVHEVILLVQTLNPEVVIMLLGKKRVWGVMPDSTNIIKCRHPSHGWGPTVQEWKKVEHLLLKKGHGVDLRTRSVRCK